MSAAAVDARELSYRYPDGTAGLEHVTFRLQAGERVALLGANGAGKSTLLLLLAGMLRGSGTLEIDGLPVNRRNLPEVRRRVGILFQDPDDQLFCPSVLEDVTFGPANLGVAPEAAHQRAMSALAQAGIAHLAHRPAHHLSLGEKRRAALAAVLSMEPTVLLMDEPTSSLDPRGRRELAHLLRGLDGTQLVATHNLDFARRTCDRALVLLEKRLTYDGQLLPLLEREQDLEAWGLQ